MENYWLQFHAAVQFVIDNWRDEICTHVGLAYIVAALCHDSDPYWKWSRVQILFSGTVIFSLGIYIGLTN